jgi:glycosyltransferase involved in cell wall biosynthesis
MRRVPLRIAFFGPLRPVPSGISDYCEELLPYLAQEAEIALFVDGYEPTNLLIRRQFPIHDYREFPQQHQAHPFDLCLYHMGNHICHAYIYETLQRYPGVVVLHDTVLHHFLGEYLPREGGLAAFLTAFPDEEGRSLLRRRRAGLWSHLDHFLYPGIGPVVRASRGIIVHSETARQAVLRAVPTARVAVIPHHLGPQRSPYAHLPQEEVKRRLGYRPEHWLIISPGIVTPSRRIETLLRVFADLLREVPQARCAIVGPDHPAVRVADRVHEAHLDGLVRVTGFVDVPTFQSYLLAADVVVNLRYPLAGETSGGLIRALGAGKPVIVSNVGQYAEFPDDVCLKADVGHAEEAMVSFFLHALARDPALGRRIAEQARRYIGDFHSLEGSARAYLEFCREVLSSPVPTPAEPPLGPEGDVRAVIGHIREEAARRAQEEAPWQAAGTGAIQPS